MGWLSNCVLLIDFDVCVKVDYGEWLHGSQTKNLDFMGFDSGGFVSPCSTGRAATRLAEGGEEARHPDLATIITLY